MKNFILLFLLISLFQITKAQTVKATGSVKNVKGAPLTYALVQDKEVKSATYTDSSGSFSLPVAPNSTLLVTSKGYKDALVKIDNATNLQIVLQEGDASRDKDNSSQSLNTNVDVTANDAFTGHTNMSSSYNSSNATQGGQAKFNGSSFPIMKEKEETHGSRFLFADWLGGNVMTDKGEEVKNPEYLFKYDKIRGVLLLTHDQKSAIDVDKDQVKSFTLYDKNTKQPYVFERLSSVDNVHFMQVLAAGDKYKIYKLTTTKFIKSDETTNGLVSSGNPYDEYANENTYYVVTVKDNQAHKLNLKKKSIKEIFGEEGDKLNNFYSQNNSDSIDDQFLKSLGDYMNK